MRKETKQGEALTQSLARNKELESEVKELTEAVSKDDRTSELEALRTQVRELEDDLYKAQYELKRKDMQLEAAKAKCSVSSGDNSAEKKHIALLESQLATMVENHNAELDALRLANEESMKQCAAQSKAETAKIALRIESEIKELRAKESAASAAALSTLQSACLTLSSQSSHVCSFSADCEGCKGGNSRPCSIESLNDSSEGEDKPSLPFASKFSTDTLDLDLDFTFDNEPMQLDPSDEAVLGEEDLDDDQASRG